MPPAPGLAGSTLRQVIHLSIGGRRLRVRLSNEFGDGPLAVASAHVALSDSTASDTPLAFGGHASVVIPPGRAIDSDPVELSCAALSELTVSMFITAAPAAVTGHPGSRTTSYLAVGNHVADERLPAAATTEHWYIISGVDVDSPADAAVVVVLGNSIADGRGSGTNKNDRWPDNLARRLQHDPRTALVAVANAGIGGNAVLRGGLGPYALSRLSRDVTEVPGVRWLILSEGVNDIGAAQGADSSASVARQLIAAYQTIITRARAANIIVYGATILPFGGSQYGNSEHEAARQTVNAWMRGQHAFDALIDFDAVMRDPADSTRLRGDADSGDHLHPNENGYRIMADAIDLAPFARRR